MFVCFLFLFGGFKGDVRWPEGPPHLALNPPYLFFFCFCLVFVFFVLFWATSLGPKPSFFLLFFSLLFVFFLVPFLSLFFNRKTLFFP